MKCDKCGNESKYTVKILSEEQDIKDIWTINRSTEQTPTPPPMDVKMLSFLYHGSNTIGRDYIYNTYIFT